MACNLYWYVKPINFLEFGALLQPQIEPCDRQKGHETLRFARRMWRKARDHKDGDEWPLWVKLQKPVAMLFDTMQPCSDGDGSDDGYDAAKAWGLEPRFESNM